MGGGKKDGFIATGVIEIVYEQTDSLPPLSK